MKRSLRKKLLKNNKACGGDMILNEFLKHAADKLMPVFVKNSMQLSG
jgi:hypothetical protein